MTIFSQSVFDATVIYQGHELFKGQGAANGWAAKVAQETGAPVTVEKFGTGWVLVGAVDGEPRRWCIIGQRIAPLTE
jgi:hypothetical protein